MEYHPGGHTHTVALLYGILPWRPYTHCSTTVWNISVRQRIVYKDPYRHAFFSSEYFMHILIHTCSFFFRIFYAHPYPHVLFLLSE